MMFFSPGLRNPHFFSHTSLNCILFPFFEGSPRHSIVLTSILAHWLLSAFFHFWASYKGSRAALPISSSRVMAFSRFRKSACPRFRMSLRISTSEVSSFPEEGSSWLPEKPESPRSTGKAIRKITTILNISNLHERGRYRLRQAAVKGIIQLIRKRFPVPP